MEENLNIPDPRNTGEVTTKSENQVLKKEKLPEITNESLSYLSTAAKWAKFLSIIGFVSVGILGLLGVFMGISLTLSEKMSAFPAPMPKGLLGLIYVIIAVIYFFPALYLYRFSESTTRSLLLKDTLSLTDAIFNLKKTFKFIGIATIVTISLYILIIIGAVIFVVYMASHGGFNQY
ncbi:MAG: hypothetical protein HXX14_18600 [Bacteroidetes bacterium]|nr:hypothetical protein [Bacteroidota bacterium]